MRLVNSMRKAFFCGAPVVGMMGRLRPPAAPARLVLMGHLVLVIFLQCALLGSSLGREDETLYRFGEEMSTDAYNLKSTYDTEKQEGEIHSSAPVSSWDGGRQNIRRLLQRSDSGSGKAIDGAKPSKGPSPSPSPLPPPASRTAPPAAPPLDKHDESSRSNATSTTPSKKKLYIYLIPVVVVVAALAVILVLFLHRKRMKPVKPWKTGLSGQLQKALVTGVPQLKRSEVETACESFSNIIGSLSDGTVYKGTLSSGVEIAVSVIKANKHWTQSHKTQFKKKIAMLSRVNHKNFVNLIGYCEENDPFTRMLIFEYAPNGTLFEHLHIRESQDLSWSSRLRVAVGVAYCLEFMHQLNPPIILKNLDSNVIYLTDDFAAKIADMELWSKTADGFPGTRAPENLQHEMPDKESIVHKFGIVLLELLSGRPPYSDENYGLVSWASDYLKGGKPLKEMIDPQLIKVREEDAKSLFEVIKSCLKPNPSERPTMSEVAAQLKVITGISPEGAAPRLSPLWWAELEIISTEAT